MTVVKTSQQRPTSDNRQTRASARRRDNDMINIGTRHLLEVVTELDFGFYLDAQNLGEVLLPRKLAPENLKEGDSVDVFLYLDSEDRPIATTQTPKAVV